MKLIFLELRNQECPVQIFLDGIAIEARRKILRQLTLFETNVEIFKRNPKFFKKIVGSEQYNLYEFRIRFNKTQYRILVHLASTICYLIHAFIKKDQKVRKKDIKLAEQRIQTYLYIT